jgi:hypothetical protein
MDYPGIEPSLRGEKPANNPLSYGTALRVISTGYSDITHTYGMITKLTLYQYINGHSYYHLNCFTNFDVIWKVIVHYYVVEIYILLTLCLAEI